MGDECSLSTCQDWAGFAGSISGQQCEEKSQVTQTCSLERGPQKWRPHTSFLGIQVTMRLGVGFGYGKDTGGSPEGREQGCSLGRVRVPRVPRTPPPAPAQMGRLPWWGVGPRGLPKDTGKRRPPRHKLEAGSPRAVKEFRVVGLAERVASTVGPGPSRAWHICGEGKARPVGVCAGGRLVEGGARGEEGREPQRGWSAF